MLRFGLPRAPQGAHISRRGTRRYISRRRMRRYLSPSVARHIDETMGGSKDSTVAHAPPRHLAVTPSGSIARERKREVHAGSPPSPAVTPLLPERGIGCSANSKAPLRRGEVPTGTGGESACTADFEVLEICALRAREMHPAGARYVAPMAQREMAHYRAREMRPAVARDAPYGCGKGTNNDH